MVSRHSLGSPSQVGPDLGVDWPDLRGDDVQAPLRFVGTARGLRSTGLQGPLQRADLRVLAIGLLEKLQLGVLGRFEDLLHVIDLMAEPDQIGRAPHAAAHQLAFAAADMAAPFFGLVVHVTQPPLELAALVSRLGERGGQASGLGIACHHPPKTFDLGPQPLLLLEEPLVTKCVAERAHADRGAGARPEEAHRASGVGAQTRGSWGSIASGYRCAARGERNRTAFPPPGARERAGGGAATRSSGSAQVVPDTEAMDLTRDPKATRRGPRENFTGTVWVDEVAANEAPSRVRAGIVHFEPGARTAWHRHPLGQVIHVLEGEGRAQAEGSRVEMIRGGERCTSSPVSGTGTEPHRIVS